MGSEMLTQAEYERHVAEKTLRMAFIGMSNVGKSYRAKMLNRESNFMMYSVDDAIIKDLGMSVCE